MKYCQVRVYIPLEYRVYSNKNYQVNQVTLYYSAILHCLFKLFLVLLPLLLALSLTAAVLFIPSNSRLNFHPCYQFAHSKCSNWPSHRPPPPAQKDTTSAANNISPKRFGVLSISSISRMKRYSSKTLPRILGRLYEHYRVARCRFSERECVCKTSYNP